MGKKSFVNKKKAATFRLVGFSGDGQSVFSRLDDGTNHVPGFTDHQTKKSCESQGGPLADHMRREIIDLGFPDDGYNYLRHFTVCGGGFFVPSTIPWFESVPQPDVKAYDASNMPVKTNNGDDSNSSGLYAMSSSIACIENVEEVIDPEVLAQLDNGDNSSEFDSDVEDLEEDFVIQANTLE